MNISEKFWETLREARVNHLLHGGFEREFAEYFADLEYRYRKQLSEKHEPWAGVVATVESEDDDEGGTHWFIVCKH